MAKVVFKRIPKFTENKKRFIDTHERKKELKKLSTRETRLESKLLEHQKRIVRYMLNHRGVLAFHGMGSGKTRIAVILVAILKMPAVVVLPAALRENFRKEIQKTNLKDSLFTILSLQHFLEHSIDCRGKILIVDEAHTLRNAEGKISQKVVKSAETAEKILLLTGTPLVNRPSDIAPLLNMIVKNKISIPISTGLITKKVFTSIPTGNAFETTFGEDGLNSIGKKLWSELFPCLLSYYIPPKSPDFPSMKVIDIKVPMTPEQINVYRAWQKRSMTKEMVQMLSSKNLPEDITSLPQFRAYLDGGRRICNVVDVKNHIYAPKFKKMVDIIENHSGKALVFSHYLSKGVDVASQELIKHDIRYVEFTGRESEKKKKEAVDMYNKDKTRVFLLSSAGGVGLDLHESESVHIMDPGWNESDIQQVIFRAIRYKSHSKPNAVVTVYRYFATLDQGISADEYLFNLSKKKEKINKSFLEFAKEHSIEEQGIGSCLIDIL